MGVHCLLMPGWAPHEDSMLKDLPPNYQSLVRGGVLKTLLSTGKH
jgi:hypothetical protein